MKSEHLTGFFENYLKTESLFLQRNVFLPQFTPDGLLYREEQVQQVAQILAPALRAQKPSNLFIYGKTGTGKTLTIRYVTSQLQQMSASRNIPLKILFLNCKLRKIADTEYRVIAHLARELGKEIPATGLPTEEVYNIFCSSVAQLGSIVIIVLDEIDELIKRAGDEILYTLTRINSELPHSQVSIVGISNDLRFTENMDPRVKSSLSEEELVFPPYNALQIQQILRQRAEKGFAPGVLSGGLIEKCAAIAAREHGDARRALELLRVAGELAERAGSLTIDIPHLDLAEQKVETDRLLSAVSTAPKQSQLLLYSVLKIADAKPHEPIFTGQIYEAYQQLTTRAGLRPLTLRRVSDVIAELDMQGIIQSKVISKGRYGRTREVIVPLDPLSQSNMKTLLEEALDL